MLTLLFFLALQVVTPHELACIGSIQEESISPDVFVAAVDKEGTTTLASPGQILYLNGPRVSALKVGSVQRVVRPEGRIHDPSTRLPLGMYFKDIGQIRVETVGKENAIARVLNACHGIIKGDLVVPEVEKTVVEFNGTPSGPLTPVTKGLTGSILLGKDDVRTLGAGQFCFIGVGRRDGVKLGDRFTVYRPHPAFNPRDLSAGGTRAFLTYSSAEQDVHKQEVNEMMRTRSIPPRILGDIVVIDVGAGTSTARVISSFSEMIPGDLVVRR